MNILQEHMDRKGLTASDVARLCDIAPSTVTRHLKGAEPTRGLLERYHQRLKIPLRALLAWKVAQPPREKGGALVTDTTA